MTRENMKYQKLLVALALAMVLGLAVFLVAGCSSGEAEQKEGTAVQSTAETTAGEEQAEEGAVKEEHAAEGEHGPATEQEAIQNQRLSDEEDVKALYAKACGACHAHDGTGLVGPNIKDAGLTYAAIKQVIENGRNNMPGFKGGELSDEQINKISDYVAGGLK